jgi:hypothetical protein
MTYGCLQALQVKSFGNALLETRQGSVRDERKGLPVGIDEPHLFEGVKESTAVILSTAKDLRSCSWFNYLRKTAVMLRCAP